MARVYLDSCIVIYLIQGPEELSNTILQALRSNASALPAVFTSDLARLECRVWPIRHGDEELLHQFDDFFSSDDLYRIPFTPQLFDLATELRALHGAKTPDALHLAAAILGECQEFWTNDRRLNAAAEKRIEIKIFS